MVDFMRFRGRGGDRPDAEERSGKNAAEDRRPAPYEGPISDVRVGGLADSRGSAVVQRGVCGGGESCFGGRESQRSGRESQRRGFSG